MTSRSVLAALAGAAALGLCSPAFAQAPGNYWGFGYTGLEYASEFTPIGATSSVTEKISTNGGTFKLGREFGKFFAIEAHVGYAKESQANAFGDKFEFAHGAAYARLNLPYERFNFYVMGGQAQADIDVGSFDDDDTYNAGGVGMDFFGSERTAFTLEYLRYQDSDDVEVDLITIGFKHHFNYAGFR